MSSLKRKRSGKEVTGGITIKKTRSTKVRVEAGSTKAASTSEENCETSMLLQLPEMVLLHIFTFLSVKDKCRSSRVCKTFRRLLKDSQMWKHIDLSMYIIKLQDLTKITRRYLSKSLRELELKGFLFTTVKTNLLSDVYLEELRSRCPNISKLVISNAELRHLISSKLPKSLVELHLVACQLREGWLTPAIEAGVLSNVKCLDVSGCGRITNRDVTRFVQLINLEEMNLLGCYRLTDQALETISSEQVHLRTLLIGHADFTENGILVLAESMKDLRSFSIQNCEFLTNQSLKYIQKMKTLEELDISYNPQFDKDSIFSLVKALPKLRKITVQDINSVSDAIMTINPNIEVL